MEKSFNKWLVISFMLGVCIFCFAYLTKLSKGGVSQLPAVAETEKSPITEEVVKPQPTPVNYNTLPKTAHTAEKNLIQNVGGADAELLQSVHTVNNQTYIFFDTSSNGHDVKSERACVAAATLDSNLTLTKVKAYCGTDVERFAGIKLTADGFILVTSAATYNCVYKLNFDLVVTEKLTLETSETVRLFYQNDRLYLMLQKADKLQIKVLSPSLEVLQTCSTALDNAKILEVFPSNDCLSIFVNGADYYGLLRYTDSGFISVNLINGCNLLAVQPYSADVNQCFVGLKKAQTVSIFTTDNLFNETASKDLGAAQFAALFPLGENFSVYLKTADNTARLAIYCKHLDNILSKSSSIVFDYIGYRDYSPTAVTFTAYCGNRMFLLSFDGIDFTTSAEYYASRGYSYVTHDGTLCFSSAASDAYSRNYGKTDVFLIKAA